MQTFKQLLAILRITKPKHILNAVVSPGHTLKVFKYHYRRVSERTFVNFIAEKWGYSSEDVSRTYNSYENNRSLWEETKEKLSIYPNSYALQMIEELSTLYLLVNLLRPKCIVETGVSAGASSTYILQALHDNREGKLHSIDLPPDNLPNGKSSGWVVPQYLRGRWSLYLGDSKKLLEPLLQNLKQIDLFVHDSLHTYEHMMWEFRTVWNYLIRSSLFLSHDVGANDAFHDFMKAKDISWKDYRVFNVLGGFRKEI
jgi:hypothetical protein